MPDIKLYDRADLEQLLRNIDRRQFFKISSVAGLGAVFATCGGGNHGPTSPTDPDPQPTNNLNAIAKGEYMGLTSNRRLSGPVNFGIYPGQVTDGNFSVPVNGSEMTVVFPTTNDYFERKLKVNVPPGTSQSPKEDLVGTIKGLETVVDGEPINLEWLDRSFRTFRGAYNKSPYQDATNIWTSTPDIIFDTGSIPLNQISFIEKIAREYADIYMPRMTNNKLIGAQVYEQNLGIQNGAAISPDNPIRGKIVVTYLGDKASGSNALVWVDENNYIIAGQVFTSMSTGDSSMRHELSHILGAMGADVTYLDPKFSSMNSVFRNSLVPTSSDIAHFRAVYSMPPGTRSPFDTSHLGSVSPQTISK